jgi:peptidyl-prolyl cis-trans isomerase A (cyclophilin A)
VLSYLRRLGALAPAILLAQAPVLDAPKPPAPQPGLYAVLETSMGAIRFRLLEKEAPITAKNFVELATGAKTWTDPRIGLPVRKRLYDGLTFHRVVPDFVIQGGDPLGTGAGGTRVIPDEFRTDVRFDVPGRVAMANSGPNTSSCQFFITVAPTPQLNGLHTIFGQVVEGLEVARKIAAVDAQNERPVDPVRIVRVTIERVGAR